MIHLLGRCCSGPADHAREDHGSVRLTSGVVSAILYRSVRVEWSRASCSA